MSYLKIIGLSGYSTAGKDEAGKGLMERADYQRFGLADEVRSALYILNPIIGVQMQTPSARPEPCNLRTVVDHLGWDEVKRIPEVRRLMQDMGTEVGRNFLGLGTWLSRVAQSVEDEDCRRVVITDIRFPNEADWVRQMGGVVVRIEREGVGPATRPDGTVHESETALDGYPHFFRVIHNNSDVPALWSAICDTEALAFRKLDGAL